MLLVIQEQQQQISVPAKVHGLCLVFFVFFFPCCFTSTETMRLIRDGEPSTATLDFHTAPEL